MSKGRGYTRIQSKKQVKRKKNIIRQYLTEDEFQEAYKYEGKFDKGKAYCSCIMCRGGMAAASEYKDERRTPYLNRNFDHKVFSELNEYAYYCEP